MSDRDRTIAPTSDASSSTDRISNGSTHVRNTLAPSASADPPPSRNAMRSSPNPMTTTVTRTAAVATATAAAAHRLPESRSGDSPIGARVSMIPNSSRTTTAPT